MVWYLFSPHLLTLCTQVSRYWISPLVNGIIRLQSSWKLACWNSQRPSFERALSLNRVQLSFERYDQLSNNKNQLLWSIPRVLSGLIIRSTEIKTKNSQLSFCFTCPIHYRAHRVYTSPCGWPIIIAWFSGRSRISRLPLYAVHSAFFMPKLYTRAGCLSRADWARAFVRRLEFRSVIARDWPSLTRGKRWRYC